MKRILSSTVLVFLAFVLSACAGALKMRADGKFVESVTIGDSLDRSTTYTGVLDCPTDMEGNPIRGKCVGKYEAIHGPAVGGQMLVGAMGGTGAALINNNAARAVANKASCAGGACPGTGTVINVQSIAEALNQNKVDVGVNTTPPACVANNTCGK